ncbi:MAG: CRISPR-associated helicase Cas3' [Phycisphaeraceae bacterium]|nr:CRISPR-associated helicase Cas3' [Phycisphaeraceae bacterium]
MVDPHTDSGSQILPANNCEVNLLTDVQFEIVFERATSVTPFPYQQAFARELPTLVHVPTGLGKTAMAFMGWLWRRRFAKKEIREATPRRLVYCLPMRVLVEQTRTNAVQWISSLKDSGLPVDDVPVHVLMGGEDEPEWDIHPERDSIIIGTQDMLLSRALNRGYGASRARWPMHFGLLNTDCLWVFDEVQLMGSGLATTAQLEAFRRMFAGCGGPQDSGCHSVWMSATLRSDWLRTVDFKDRIDEQGRIDGKVTLSLSDEDRENDDVAARWYAKKPLSKAKAGMDEKNSETLAKEVRDAHKLGTRTIIVVNTVRRACALYDALKRPEASIAGKKSKVKNGAAPAEADSGSPNASPELVLLHSRFRPPDRAERIKEALAPVDSNGPGTIIVSTQVIEAGVDVSAATLFTELAPWASLVQRFGRCNRRGELNDVASVRWIDLPAQEADAEKVRYPYELADLRAAAIELEKLNDVGLASLDKHRNTLSDQQQQVLFPQRHAHVIRRKDLLDLFDTTLDLAGNDIDIDRYVREIEETDVRVFWRDYGDPGPKKQGATPNDINGESRAGGVARSEPAPLRDELCPAPIGEFKEFAKKHSGLVWRWNFTEGSWERADHAKIAPGQVLLVHADAGGYTRSGGWTPGSGDRVEPLERPEAGASDGAAFEDDDSSQSSRWQTIAEHTEDVCQETEALLSALGLPDSQSTALRHAARWHDWGKAHKTFQQGVAEDGRPAGWAQCRNVAKAPKEFWQRYERRYFRHELASALAVLQRPHETLRSLSDEDLDLVAYLVAAHHGKVRLLIRSMPNETKPRTDAGVPQPQKRFARGLWDGDTLPGVDLGGGVMAPDVTLWLEPMELGLCGSDPFVGQPSWIDRVVRLRGRLGPFRLAYLEAILRAADRRASAAATQAEVNHA